MLVPPIFTVSAALEVESEQASKTRLKRLCTTQMVAADSFVFKCSEFRTMYMDELEKDVILMFQKASQPSIYGTLSFDLALFCLWSAGMFGLYCFIT